MTIESGLHVTKERHKTTNAAQCYVALEAEEVFCPEMMRNILEINAQSATYILRSARATAVHSRRHN